MSGSPHGPIWTWPHVRWGIEWAIGMVAGKQAAITPRPQRTGCEKCRRGMAADRCSSQTPRQPAISGSSRPRFPLGARPQNSGLTYAEIGRKNKQDGACIAHRPAPVSALRFLTGSFMPTDVDHA